MKRTLYSVHKWLALVLALPFLVLSVTGLLMTLQPKPEPLPLKDVTYLSVPDLLQKLQLERPKATITRVNFNDQSLTAYVKADDLSLITIERETGSIIKEENPMRNIFFLSKTIHETFFMKSTGKVIVALCGLGLTLVLLSGFFYWAKKNFLPQIASLYKNGKFKKLKDLHVMAAMIFMLPLLYAGSMGFLIELNKLFWNDNPVLAHEKPTSCSFDQQINVLRTLKLDGGRINFCRADYPYLTYINKAGSREITPEGLVVQTVARSDWAGNFYFRKHHFVHLHSGDEFGIFKTPYRLVLSLGLLILNFTGLFIWWKKRKGQLPLDKAFDISNPLTSTKAL